MTEDISLIAITALLPITAGMLISQVNPYHALIIRGILGAVAALVYALLGAADVALTEALVGTMLSITLYAVTVRSSLSMRVGVIKDKDKDSDGQQPLLKALQDMLDDHHMRLEQVVYDDLLSLEQALTDKEIHTWAISIKPTDGPSTEQQNSKSTPTYHIQTRIKRLHEIMQAELSLPQVKLSWVDLEQRIFAERIPPLQDNRQTQPEGSS